MPRRNWTHNALEPARDDVLTRERLVRFIDTAGLISERAREVNGLLILGGRYKNYRRIDPLEFLSRQERSISLRDVAASTSIGIGL